MSGNEVARLVGCYGHPHIETYLDNQSSIYFSLHQNVPGTKEVSGLAARCPVDFEQFSRGGTTALSIFFDIISVLRDMT